MEKKKNERLQTGCVIVTVAKDDRYVCHLQPAHSRVPGGVQTARIYNHVQLHIIIGTFCVT